MIKGAGKSINDFFHTIFAAMFGAKTTARFLEVIKLTVFLDTRYSN